MSFSKGDLVTLLDHAPTHFRNKKRLAIIIDKTEILGDERQYQLFNLFFIPMNKNLPKYKKNTEWHSAKHIRKTQKKEANNESI